MILCHGPNRIEFLRCSTTKNKNKKIEFLHSLIIIIIMLIAHKSMYKQKKSQQKQAMLC
jgi:hypothetical protein